MQNTRSTLASVLRLATRTGRRREAQRLVSPEDHAQHASEHAVPRANSSEPSSLWNTMRMSRRARQTDKNVKQPAAAPTTTSSKQREKRADPQRAKRTEKSGPTAGEKSTANCRQEEQCQQQATPTKRTEDDDAGLQDNEVTHTRNDVHLVLGSPAVAVHRRDHRGPRPYATADPSSSDRAANDPLVTQRQLLTIQKIPKTVEIPKAQLTDMPVVIRDKRLRLRSAAD